VKGHGVSREGLGIGVQTELLVELLGGHLVQGLA
jgi:hypothetical protein